jgi:hypothetical protein
MPRGIVGLALDAQDLPDHLCLAMEQAPKA